MVLIGDDCSLPGEGIAGRRGIAGTLLITKVMHRSCAHHHMDHVLRQIIIALLYMEVQVSDCCY